jgi:hypothetical protein
MEQVLAELKEVQPEADEDVDFEFKGHLHQDAW